MWVPDRANEGTGVGGTNMILFDVWVVVLAPIRMLEL